MQYACHGDFDRGSVLGLGHWGRRPLGRGGAQGAPFLAPPCVTFRRVVAPLRGPGQSPALPFACCVGSLRSVGRCGRCSCWCRFRVRPPPPPLDKGASDRHTTRQSTPLSTLCQGTECTDPWPPLGDNESQGTRDASFCGQSKHFMVPI